MVSRTENAASSRQIANACASPGFILSSERSGSNLVRSILNTHSRITAPHPIETAYPWRYTAPLDSLSPNTRRNLIRDVVINKHYSFHPLNIPIDVNGVASLVESAYNPNHITVQHALYEVCAANEKTQFWMSKYPGIWEWLDDILDYYNQPKFVYLVRDPRDVVLSFKTSNIELYHPYFSANRWREEQRRGIQLLETNDEIVHLLRYQDLLRNPEREVHEICEFLDLEFEEEMLYYYQTEEAQATSKSSSLLKNISVPIKSDNYDKFREQLPEDEIKITEKIVRTELEYFDYKPIYTEGDLSDIELDENKYRKIDRNLERRATIGYWWNQPFEQMKRQFTKSFAAYMALRYGILA